MTFTNNGKCFNDDSTRIPCSCMSHTSYVSCTLSATGPTAFLSFLPSRLFFSSNDAIKAGMRDKDRRCKGTSEIKMDLMLSQRAFGFPGTGFPAVLF